MIIDPGNFFTDVLKRHWFAIVAVIVVNIAFAAGAIWLAVKIIKAAWG